IPSKKNHTNRSRLVTSFHNDYYSHRVKKPSIPSTAYKNPTRVNYRLLK
ncbi:unnamed protein product, partial [Rotaria magnacalcarata]